MLTARRLGPECFGRKAEAEPRACWSLTPGHDVGSTGGQDRGGTQPVARPRFPLLCFLPQISTTPGSASPRAGSPLTCPLKGGFRTLSRGHLAAGSRPMVSGGRRPPSTRRGPAQAQPALWASRTNLLAPGGGGRTPGTRGAVLESWGALAGATGTHLSLGQDLLLVQLEGRADPPPHDGWLLPGAQRVLDGQLSCQLLRQEERTARGHSGTRGHSCSCAPTRVPP